MHHVICYKFVYRIASFVCEVLICVVYCMAQKFNVEFNFTFLNQAHTWFIKIDPVRFVGMRACVCVSAPKAINN